MEQKLKRTSVNWLLITFILLGAFLRWNDIREMSDTLYYDEAYEGNDALTLVQQPRLTPFFPGDNGRESGWMYVLAPFVGVFDMQPFALRLASTMAGVLTLVAVYALAKELVEERVATWSVGALAVLFWHVHLSRIALRAILLPLVGALACALLLRAYRRRRYRDWVLGGVALGLMTYTYFSARGWIGYAVILLLGLAIFDARRRAGSLLALGIALMLSVPLIIYTFSFPDVALLRIGSTGVFGLPEMIGNVGLWLQAFFYQGDVKFLLNLANRPVFDSVLGGFFLIGLVALPAALKQRWQWVWLIGLSAIAIAPSIVTGDAPHFLRAIGLVVPIAIVCGAGVSWIEQRFRRLKAAPWISWLPIGLLGLAGWFTYQDAHVGWFNQPEIAQFLQYESRLLNYLKNNVPADAPVYLPFTDILPIIDPGTDFRRAYLAPRPTSFFNPEECWIASSLPAVYTIDTAGAAGYRRALGQWADVTKLAQNIPKTDFDPTTFTVFKAVPHADFLSDTASPSVTFSDQLLLRLLEELPSTVRPGDTLDIKVRVKPLRRLDNLYSVLVHLYQIKLDQSVDLFGQGDSPLCISYPTNLWQPHEIAIQDFSLQIPPDLPAGNYAIAIGIYNTETVARLPVTSPASSPEDYFVLQTISVSKP